MLPRFSAIAWSRTSSPLTWEARRRTSVVADGRGTQDRPRGYGGWGENGSWGYGPRAVGGGVSRGLGPGAGGVRIEPCLPPSWRRVDVTIRRPGGGLAIAIENPDGVETGIAECWVDGVAVDQAVVAFPADGRERRVTVRLGPEKRPTPL